MNKKLQGTLALLAGTLIWGTAFIAQSVGMDHIGPFTFQGIRCLLAVLFLLPCSFLLEPDKHRFFEKWRNPRLWKTGLICGIALFVASGLQQVGLIYTDAGKAGFLTAMYIVLVPVLGIFLRVKPSKSILFSVVIAVAGLYLLCGTGNGKLNMGDLCLIGCAFAFSVQITLIDRLSGNLDGIRLNCVQSFVCSALSFLVMLLTEAPAWSNIVSCALPLGYAGILSMGVAYTLQIVGQKHLEPAGASLIMSLESVFAAVFGWLLLGERMSGTELMGCGLMFAAVILSQLPEKKRTTKLY